MPLPVRSQHVAPHPRRPPRVLFPYTESPHFGKELMHELLCILDVLDVHDEQVILVGGWESDPLLGRHWPLHGHGDGDSLNEWVGFDEVEKSCER
jgi:hypothetical protein